MFNWKYNTNPHGRTNLNVNSSRLKQYKHNDKFHACVEFGLVNDKKINEEAEIYKKMTTIDCTFCKRNMEHTKNHVIIAGFVLPKTKVSHIVLHVV